MKKLNYLIILFPVILTGCIGRTVVYDQSSSKKDYKDIPNIQTQTSSTQNKYSNFSPSYKSFILKNNPKLDPDLASNIAYFVAQYSKENEIEPKLILALMSRESSFRANVVSSSGAIGLGQLMKSTAKDMGVDDPFNPEENTKATTKYIGWLMKKWQGNVDLALASYKMGHFAVTNLVRAGRDLPDSTKKYINEIRIAQDKIADVIE